MGPHCARFCRSGVEPSIDDIEDPETRPETANIFNPILVPDLPFEACLGGADCGFATLVSGTGGSSSPADTTFGSFTLAADGTRFSVSPAAGDSLDSVTMTTLITSRSDGYSNLRATGRSEDLQSRLLARVVANPEAPTTDLILAADSWASGPAGSAQSGFFAWGIGTSAGSLGGLNTSGISLNFTGPMSVDNSTVGSMTVNFGASPTWTGTWTNPAFSFGAGAWCPEPP